MALILEIALARPAWGCNRIEAMPRLEGRRVSPPTVRKILDRHEMGTRHRRWQALERRASEDAFEPTAERTASIETQNPAFRERHV